MTGERATTSPEHQFVVTELQDAVFEERGICDAAARVIAGWLHGGQSSAFYSFQSTGAIDYDRMQTELDENYKAVLPLSFDELCLDELANYLIDQTDVDDGGNRGPVEGWHQSTQWETTP